MELAGRVIAVLEPKGGTSRNGNEWKVQEYVIETHDQYPRQHGGTAACNVSDTKNFTL